MTKKDAIELLRREWEIENHRYLTYLDLETKELDSAMKLYDNILCRDAKGAMTAIERVARLLYGVDITKI